MRTVSVLTGVALSAALAAAPVPVEAQAVELIINGSFEEGPKVDAWQWIDEKSDKIKGWVVTKGQIDYIGTLWKAAEGKRSLDLHGSPGFGGVKQTIKTEKGRTYRVTFEMAVVMRALNNAAARGTGERLVPGPATRHLLNPKPAKKNAAE